MFTNNNEWATLNSMIMTLVRGHSAACSNRILASLRIPFAFVTSDALKTDSGSESVQTPPCSLKNFKKHYGAEKTLFLFNVFTQETIHQVVTLFFSFF